jgi:hypothetical protein
LWDKVILGAQLNIEQVVAKTNGSRRKTCYSINVKTTAVVIDGHNHRIGINFEYQKLVQNQQLPT